MSLTPQIDNSLVPEVNYTNVEIPSKTYRLIIDTTSPLQQSNNTGNFVVDRINGYVDNIEAIKQAIYHILQTERYSYLIYSENYGIELHQYIGKDIEYIEATIEDTLREALTYDLRIIDVVVNSIDKVEIDKVLINFTAITIYGNLVLEVDINV